MRFEALHHGLVKSINEEAMSTACTQPQAPASTADQPSAYALSTAQFAQLNGIKEQSVRARLSRTGSYFGIHPLKCANRRTLWPSVIAQG